MSIARQAYSQKATYWGNPVPDGFGGFSYDAPRTLKVHWEERVEKFLSPTGDELVSNAIVWVLEPQGVEVGGFLYKGDSSEADPAAQDSVYQIRQIRQVPDLRNLLQETRAYL